MQATASWFLDLVRRSELIAEDDLTTIAAGYTDPDAEALYLAEDLVQQGFLTKFQAKLLLQGRYRDFYLLDKYKLLDLLGSGGMGRVFLCEHVRLKRQVAVKVLLRQRLHDPSSVERFYREARVIAALEHPNIVKIYDVEPDPTSPLMVMEYINGATLQSIVERAGPLSIERVCHYIAQTATGLHYVHLARLVHRDIKPGNLLVDRSGIVKILDLGLARFFNRAQDNVTARLDDQAIMGTADYFAPEQALGEKLDIRADIYALGGTMFYLLTGRAPFADREFAQKLLAHQSEDPPALTLFRHDVPEELEAILHRMMAKSPDDRFPTPADLIAALAPWTQHAIEPPTTAELTSPAPEVVTTARHTPSNGSPRTPTKWSRSPGSASVLGPSVITPANGVPSSPSSIRRSKIASSAVPEMRPLSPIDKPKMPLWRWMAMGSIGFGLLVIVGLVFVDLSGRRPTIASVVPAVQTAIDLPPDQARFHFNTAQTISFDVQRVGYDAAKTLFFLNSQVEYTQPTCFTVVIGKDIVGQPPLDLPFSELWSRFEGRRVRVQGMISEYNRNGRPQIILESAGQLELIEP